MKFILFILLVAVTLLTLWLLVHYGRVVVVAHARLLFKTWSVWLATIGSALSAWAQSFPDVALSAWRSLPEDIKSYLPHNFLGMAGAFMVAMAVMAQFIRQKNLYQQRVALKEGQV